MRAKRVDSAGRTLHGDSQAEFSYQFEDKALYETGIIPMSQFGIKEDIELRKGVYFSKISFKNTMDKFYQQFNFSDDDLHDEDESPDATRFSQFSFIQSKENFHSKDMEESELIFNKGEPYESPLKSKLSIREYQELSKSGLIHSGHKNSAVMVTNSLSPIKVSSPLSLVNQTDCK
jgi:hypothetical protein